MAGAFIILAVCNNIGSIDLGTNCYASPMFLVIASFAGWQFLYEIAFIIQRFSCISNVVACIGQNTMAVVALHFLCFKIISYIGVILNEQPLCLVAAFPVLYRDNAWWVAYTLVGLFIPICLSILWKRFKWRVLKSNVYRLLR